MAINEGRGTFRYAKLPFGTAKLRAGIGGASAFTQVSYWSREVLSSLSFGLLILLGRCRTANPDRLVRCQYKPLRS